MDLKDITIDTNVFMHCDNVDEARCQAARELVTQFIQSETLLCVDEGFDTDPAKNTSHIGHEYLTHLVLGNLGFAAVVAAAMSNRVLVVSKRVPAGHLKAINRLVHDKSDRPFVRVATNSSSKVLASHDNKAFDKCRHELKKLSGLLVREAADLLA